MTSDVPPRLSLMFRRLPVMEGPPDAKRALSSVLIEPRV